GRIFLVTVALRPFCVDDDWTRVVTLEVCGRRFPRWSAHGGSTRVDTWSICRHPWVSGHRSLLSVVGFGSRLCRFSGRCSERQTRRLRFRLQMGYELQPLPEVSKRIFGPRLNG
ncbi:unnamed protein product, partial [Scytosiphon promiscuus]